MHKTFDTPGDLQVVVDNAVGHVSIKTADAPTSSVTLEADTPDAQDLIDRATVECEPFGDRHVLRVKIPHRYGPRFMRRNGVTVRCVMSSGGDVEVETASADVELSGVFGALVLKTASGDIDADGSSAAVMVKTASGDVVIGQADGSVRLKSASGDLRASQVDGSLSAVTASGNIDVGAACGRTELRCTSGEVRLGLVEGDASIVAVSGDVRVSSCTAGRLQVRSVSGDVTVGIAEGVNLGLDAESMSGTVRSDIPLSDIPVSREGNSDVFVTARSVSGDVIFERAADAFAYE
jgi:DUF4097 and DUF4098 domain-containing protein YvlB